MNKPDLFLELQRRNARLRAWRAIGVPVTGGWSPDTTPAPAGQSAKITLGCEVCHETTTTFAYFGRRITSMYMKQKLHSREMERLRVLVESLRCTHLDRMLETEPAELVAIQELELMSNG